jgi:hypothetical protein
MRARAYIAALPSILKKNTEGEIYRLYVTDVLQNICKNVEPIGRQGYIQNRYYDIIHPKPEETRTGDEIKEHFKEKLKRLGGEQDRPT